MATPETKSKQTAGYIQLLRNNPDYRSLWSGDVISLFGDWFNLIASAALVSRLTESGFAIGGLFVVRMLAPFLISPIAGVAADRFNRKHLLILADLSRAIVVIGFLFVRTPEQVWLLYVLTAIQLAISGFFYPARNALLPNIVTPNELGAANALSSATWSVMLALGAALGGIVAGEWGTYPAFIIDAATFLLSAFFISRIRYYPAPDKTISSGSLGTVHRQYIEGLQYLNQNPDILLISLQKGTQALLVGGVFQVIQVALAEQYFTIGEGGGTSLGFLYAIAGVGTGLGPIIARRLTGDRERSLRNAIAWSYLITALGLGISAPLTSFNSVLFGSFFRTVGSGVNWVFSSQLLLLLLPDKIRGRVFSTEFAIFTLANALGAVASGWILDRTAQNISGLIWWMSILILFPGGLWTLWINSRFKTFRAQPDELPVKSNPSSDLTLKD